MSWSTSELRVRLAPLNRFKPSSKIFYWPFISGTSFVDILWVFFFVLVFAMSLYVLCGHLLGKGWPLGSRLWCLSLSLSLSHWYPGSGVVLDCINSWSLHPYLLFHLDCLLRSSVKRVNGTLISLPVILKYGDKCYTAICLAFTSHIRLI